MRHTDHLFASSSTPHDPNHPSTSLLVNISQRSLGVSSDMIMFCECFQRVARDLDRSHAITRIFTTPLEMRPGLDGYRQTWFDFKQI